MKSKFLLTTLSLSSSLLLASPTLQAQEPAAPTPVKQDFRSSNDFNLALGHLQGATDNLSLMNLERRIGTWSKLLDEAIQSEAVKALMEEELDEPLKIDLPKAIDHLGLANLSTYAMGVEQTQTGWITRSFLGIKGKAKGLLALGGTSNVPWQATNIARKDDDLILEFTLDAQHLSPWLLEAVEMINKSLPAELQEEIAMEAPFLNPEMLKEPMLPSGESILEGLNTIGKPRLILTANIPPGKDVSKLIEALMEEDLPTILESGISVNLTIDQAKGIMSLLEPLMAEFEKEESNGVQITRFFNAEMRTEYELPKDFLAQLSFDPASNKALVELGKPSKEAQGSIKESPDFLSSTAIFPQEGASLTWVSKDLVDSLHKLVVVAMEEESDMEGMGNILSPLMAQIYGLPAEGSKQGMASASYWVEGGVLGVNTSPAPPSDQSMSSGLYMMGMMGMMGVMDTYYNMKSYADYELVDPMPPAVQGRPIPGGQAGGAAAALQNTANASSLVIALISHGIEKEELPKSLEELYTSGQLDDAQRGLLTLQGTVDKEWNYKQIEADASASSVVLWAQVDDNNYLIARYSGAVTTVPKARFDKIAKDQGLK